MSYTYELVLDVLNGCKWNCLGCTVDRMTIHTYRKENFLTLKEFMITQKNKGSSLTHFEIGPTDFFTCDNLEEILNDASIGELINNFEFIFLTSTLLSRKDIDKRLAFLCDKLKNKRIYLFIPLQLERLKDKTFTQNLFDNIEYLKEKANSSFIIDKVYANVLDIPYFSSLHFDEKRNLLNWLYQQAGTKINFNYRLTSDSSPQHYSYVSSVDFLPILLREVRALDMLYEDLNIPDYLLNNKKRRGLLFKEGKLYWMPYLGKFTASLEENFQIDLSNNISESLERYELSLQSSQISYLAQTKDCPQCDFLNVCLSRGIIESMKVYNHSDCIIPDSRKKYWEKLQTNR